MLNLPQSSNQNASSGTPSKAVLPINEIFGPTLQGEGPDIGKACVFVRVHSCPVQCPGCDTAYTWNKTERGKMMTGFEIYEQARKLLIDGDANASGLVLSGGEPLTFYDNPAMSEFLTLPFAWRSVETSGYLPKVPSITKLAWFFHSFDTFCVSPKITPCLHGIQSDDELTFLLPEFRRLQMKRTSPGNLVFKFVARDEDDIIAIRKLDNKMNLSFGSWDSARVPIYLMPYGNHREEIFRNIERLMPYAQKYGYIVTPRLHSLLWGATRGV